MIGRLSSAVLVAAAVWGSVACGDDDAAIPAEAPPEAAVPTGGSGPTAFEIRPVLEEAPPGPEGCEGGELHDATSEMCVRAGTPALDGAHVVDAEAVHDVLVDRWMIDVSLTDDGAAALHALSVSCIAHEDTCPTARTALVLDGEVLTVLALVHELDTDTIQITGDFTEAEARDLALTLSA